MWEINFLISLYSLYIGPKIYKRIKKLANVQELKRKGSYAATPDGRFDRMAFCEWSQSDLPSATIRLTFQNNFPSLILFLGSRLDFFSFIFCISGSKSKELRDVGSYSASPLLAS